MSVGTRVRRWLRAVDLDVSRARYQTTLATHLLRVFRGLRVDAVLDVGAHLGEYAKGIRASGYRGAIVSFEPVAEVHAALAKAAAKDPAWRTHRLALSDRDGVAAIRVASGSVLSSFHPFTGYAGERFPDVTIDRTEEVPTRRLDSPGLLDEATAHLREPRLFLKMDTQGHDLAVLRGASGVLDRVLAIQTEASVKTLYEGVLALPEYLAALGEMGFEPSGFFPVSRDVDGLRLVEVDVVAIRKG